MITEEIATSRIAIWWERAKAESGDVNAVVFFLLILFGACLVLLLPKAASTIIGTTGVLIVAFVAYPWQKRKDRDLAVHTEKRQLAREFCAQIMEVYVMEKDVDVNLDPRFIKLNSLQAEMTLLMDSEQVVDAAAEVCAAARWLYSREDQFLISSDGTRRTRGENLIFAEKRFLAAVKAELR